MKQHPSASSVWETLLFGLLVLLPFCLLQFHEMFETRRREQQSQRQHEEMARRTLERLCRRAEIPRWLEKNARRLDARLCASSGPATSAATSTKTSTAPLREPPGFALFPEAKWWVFTSPGTPGAPLEQVSARSGTTSIRSIRRLLESLILWKYGLPQDEKSCSKIADFLFGPEYSIPFLGQLQGETIRVLHENRFWHLFWNISHTGDRLHGAYILLLPDERVTQERIIRAALALERRGGRNASSEHAVLCGYLDAEAPAGSRSRRDFAPREVATDPAFLAWLGSWNQGAEPSGQAANAAQRKSFERYDIYWRLNPAVSHHPFVCLPKTFGNASAGAGFPVPISLMAGVVFFILVLTRNVLFPIIPLRVRFAGLFGWTAVLAFVLFWIASNSYLEEMSRSESDQRREQMRKAAQDYDHTADSIHRKYQFVIQGLKGDPEFVDLLSKAGPPDIGSLATGATSIGEDVFARVLGQLRRWRLPYSIIKVAHPDGHIDTHVSAEMKGRETAGFDSVYETGIRCVLLERLQKKTGLASPPFFMTDHDRTVRDSTESTTGQSITSSFRRTLGHSLPLSLGKTILWRILDLFQDRSGFSWAVLISWKSNLLDRVIAEEALSRWRKHHPGFSFDLYRSTPAGPASICRSRRSDDPLYRICGQAMDQEGETWRIRRNLEQIEFCMPSQKNAGVWIALRSTTHDLRKAHAARKIRLGFLWVTGLFIVLLMTWIFSRRLVAPLLHLSHLLERPEEYDPDLLAHSRRPDEIGALFQAFGAMVEGMKARRRLAALVSGPSLQLVCEGLEGIPVGGGTEIRIIALVSDIRGFTTLCETHPPQAMTSLLNRHFDGMSDVINGFGGSIDRFIGDAVNAVFVIQPGTEAETTRRAIRAGVAMLAEVDRINADRSAQGLFTYRTGIGLAEGTALVAGLGDRTRRMDICFLGPVFETAAGLEAASKLCPEFPLIFDEAIARIVCEDSIAAGVPQPARLPGQDGWYIPIGGAYTSHLIGSALQTSPPAPGPDLSPMETGSAKMRPATEEIAAEAVSEDTTWNPIFRLVLALVIIGVPLGLFWQGFMAADENDFWWRSQEAHDRNLLFLRHLSGQNPREVSLEANLERTAQRVAEQLSNAKAHGIPSDLPRRVKADLESRGIAPLAVVIVPGERPGDDRGFDALPTWVAEDASGRPRISRQHLIHMLVDLVALYDQRNTILAPYGQGAWSSINPEESLDLYSYRRAKLIPTTLASTVCNLFWQPLLRPSRFDLLSERARANPAWKSHLQTFAGYHPDLKGEFLQGGIMVILPPVETGQQELGRALKETCDQRTVGAIFASRFSPSAAGEGSHPSRVSDGIKDASLSPEASPTLSAGFGEFWEAYARTTAQSASIAEIRGLGPLLQLPPTFGDWSIDWAFLNGRSDQMIVLATRFLPPGPGARLRTSLLEPGFLLFTLLVTLLLLRSIRSRTALGSTLNRQFLGGLAASVAPPLAGLFLLMNLLGNHWERNLLQATRDDLSHRWQDFDQRITNDVFSIQKAIPSFWAKHGLEKNDNLSAIAREFARPPFFTTLGSMVALKLGSEPLRLDCFGRISTQIDPVTTVTAFHGGKIMERRFPHVARSLPEPDSKRLVKKEMATEFVLGILETTFGAHGLMRLLFHPGRIVDIPVGQTSELFLQYFAPDPASPAWFLSFSFNDYSRRNSAAGARMGAELLAPSGDPDQPRLILLDRDSIGMPTIPEDGERFSFLRSLGRMTQADRQGFASWVEDGQTRFFAEVMTGVLSPQHLGIWVIPESTIFAACNRQRLILTVLAALVFLLLFAVSWLASRNFTAPIRLLIDGFAAVERGEFSFRLPESRNDELGQVMIAFNRMSQGLAERELLSRLVSKTARTMSNDAEAERQALEGSRQTATILYCSMAHQPFFDLGAPEPGVMPNVSGLNSWVTSVCRIVGDAGGDIDKILGDKILAIFYHSTEPGSSEAQHDQIRKACTAALAICRESGPENAGHSSIHIGINTGEVICGLMGSHHRRDHTVIGDAVNLAARCCSIAHQWGPIVLSGATADAVKPAFQCHRLDITTVKGKNDPVLLYRLEGGANALATDPSPGR